MNADRKTLIFVQQPAAQIGQEAGYPAYHRTSTRHGPHKYT